MTTIPPSGLSDAALLAETVRAAGADRHATADLVALLAEVDARRLYLGQGYASLFAWCIGALQLSEPARLQPHHGCPRGTTLPDHPHAVG